MTEHVLITGGAGFIGCNLAAHLASCGTRVRIYDDLSRSGVDRNLAWLERSFGPRIEVRVGDVRDRDRVRASVEGVDTVFHFAAQVAVTTGLTDPIGDFDVNARGTLEVLEAVRMLATPPAVVFTSTNKVYGCLPDLALRVDGDRWTPVDARVRDHGIDEARPLELRTPYGCSKGAADQYVLDYTHSYGVRAAVFRMSCIYGPHQLGTEDQGWVAHFVNSAIDGKRITICGDGKQVRDVLFVDDLVAALVRARAQIAAISGRAFNIGGGPAHSISLLELLAMLDELRGAKPPIAHEPWRTGDQRYYVSNTSAFTALTGWRPQVGPRAGVEALHGWLIDHRRTAP